MKKEKHKIYIINTLFTLLIIGIGFKINKIFPFGNDFFGKSDGIHQFQPMIYDFIMKIKTGTFSIYSFNNSLGNPFVFNWIYYFSSPINFIALLCKKTDSMNLLIIIVKMVIATISMTYYTSKKTDNTKALIIAPISYVFSTWFLVYYYYLAWVDLFMVFPLLQYGIEQIIDNKKSYLYIFSLSYMILCNFYLCFSICIYAIIYFVIYVFFYKNSSRKEKIQLFLKFIVHNFFVGLLSFVFLYLLVKIYIKTGISMENKFKETFVTNIPNIINSLFYLDDSFTTGNEIKYVFPNIACNLYVLYHFIAFFINKNISKKDKKYTAISTIIIIICLLSTKIDFVLNFFHSIRGLAYRYSFIISFLMICVYIKNESANFESNKNTIKIIPILIIIMLLLSVGFDDIDEKLFIIIVTLLLLAVIIIFHSNNKIYTSYYIFFVFLSSILGMNMLINHSVIFDPIPIKQDEYIKDTVKYRKNIADIKCDFTDRSDNFYLYYNEKVTNIYSSMTYNKIIYLARDLGIITFENTFINADENNLVFRMLFNEKESGDHNRYLEKIYSVSNKIKEVRIKEENKGYKNQNSIIAGMTNTSNIFNKIELEGTKAYNKCLVKVDKKNFKKIYYYEKIDLESDSIILPVEKCNNKINVYTYNEEKLDEAYEYLKKNQIQYTFYSDSKLEGTINVDENQLIFTSIPYDIDWEIYVDGQRVKPIKLLDSLIGIEVEPGKHKINMEYKEHIIWPTLISLTTLICIIIDMFRTKIKNNQS